MDKSLGDLIDIIRFTEKVATKIHRLLNEAEIYKTVANEFAKSKKYTIGILLLTDSGSKLSIVESSLSPRKTKAGEKIAGVKLKRYKINLGKSNIYSQVVRKGKTIQVNVDDIIAELFPQPLAYLISKATGYEKNPCILTPLRRKKKIIGSLAISSTNLADYFIPSVKNLAYHLSTALELAQECTRRKKIEQELRQLVESQKEFIYHLGHELRTPLAVIKAMAESQMEKLSSVRTKPFVLINKKVNQMTQIIENLSLISRLDIGQEKTHQTKFQLKDLLKETSEDTIREAQRENINPVVRLTCSPNIKLKTARSKLSQVLTNLLRNAIVHSGNQPQIFLKVKKLKGKIQIIVEDNNKPIPKSDLKKVFERHYRRKARKKTTGLGLGLHISKRLVGLMKGKIWAESKRQGNRFVVQLPNSS